MRKIVVYHGSYGCQTGCCGHVIKMGDEEEFEFDHPWESSPTEEKMREFAEDMVRQAYGEEHIKDLDWENCLIVNFG